MRDAKRITPRDAALLKSATESAVEAEYDVAKATNAHNVASLWLQRVRYQLASVYKLRGPDFIDNDGAILRGKVAEAARAAAKLAKEKGNG